MMGLVMEDIVSGDVAPCVRSNPRLTDPEGTSDEPGIE